MTPIISNFPSIVKSGLQDLPRDDYPVLNTFLFVSIWLGLVLDQSQSSMRSVFKRLNIRGKAVDISTFSKASKVRDTKVFVQLFEQLRNRLKKQRQIKPDQLSLFPLDSTIVTLTSKLLWAQGYHRVKLFSGLELLSASPAGIVIHFGQGHDSKYGDETIAATPENAVSVMDRGFASLKRIQGLKAQTQRYFILRIKNNMHLEMTETGECLVGTGKDQVQCRVVVFSDLESRSEFRFVTNLPAEGESAISNEEIGNFYILRWQIELLWKFLKMHLKLSRLITKNTNGIEIQIYACLIGYVILQLVSIPQEFGKSALDKLRYLQAFMCENISYVHWLERIVFLH